MTILNPPALLDELLGLLDGAPFESAAETAADHPTKTTGTVPASHHEAQDLTLLPAPPAAEVVDLEAARRKREKRQALVDTAVDVTAAFLESIRDAQQSGATDFDDAIKGLPVVHRLIEHAERSEAARRDAASMPTISVSIGRAPWRTPAISVKVQSGRRPTVAPIDTIDLED